MLLFLLKHLDFVGMLFEDIVESLYLLAQKKQLALILGNPVGLAVHVLVGLPSVLLNLIVQIANL